jgi:hypothetical protein
MFSLPAEYLFRSKLLKFQVEIDMLLSSVEENVTVGAKIIKVS